MAPAEKFYILSHIFISLIGSVLMMALWYNIRLRFSKLLKEEESQKRVDLGLAYVSAALFVWVLSGIWGYFSALASWEGELFSHGLRILLSTLNNFLLLLALFHFSEAPQFIHKNVRNVRFITILFSILAIASVVLFQVFGREPVGGVMLSFLPDLLLSGFLSNLLIVSFYKVFRQRGLQVVALISIAVVGIMFYSQLPEVFVGLDDDFGNNLMKIIAKSSLISVFLVLATNWAIQLANTPKASEMRIQFLDWSLIVLSVPSKGVDQITIDFKSKTTQFKNLLKFALRRKFGQGEDQYLQIGHGQEIDRQTYLTRIVNNINEIANAEEDEKLERKDLFTFVGQGKYRIRIIPGNIEIDKTLLEEFVNDSENQVYKKICKPVDLVT